MKSLRLGHNVGPCTASADLSPCRSSMRSGRLNRARTVVVWIVAIGLAWTAWQVAPSASDRQRARAADAAPADAAERVAWTSGRVSGSPEPAPPYQLEQAFPKLNFNQPV